MSFVGEAVIAARAPGHDLLPVLGYKSLAAEAVERAVERSGGHVHGAVRKLLGALDDPVAVQRSVEQRGESEVGRRTHRAREYNG